MIVSRIAITTGDIDGIGFEITAKALSKIKSQKEVIFFLWRSPNSEIKYLKLIDKYFKRITVSSWEDALKVNFKSRNTIVDICSKLSPAHWVEISANACMYKKLDGIVTAPISKSLIKNSGFNDLGHTDILRRISGKKYLKMGFLGKKFNVVLATDHISFSTVTSALDENTLKTTLELVDQLRMNLDKNAKTRPIAVLGLNPHAGESGLIGCEEVNLIKPFIDKYSVEYNCVGPLVPDAAFFKENWKKYSVFLAMYHDQGLIPFKLVHGQDSGVHLTLGLPFTRTSVDHGTAKDIFGKNKANPSSMIDAIEWCVKSLMSEKKQ